MNIREPLTKENFWNGMMEMYPKAMENFCTWIDEYKKAVNWDKLFPRPRDPRIHGIKFHDLPYAMQNGIWIEYCRQTLHKFFEQPEHYSEPLDFEEDVKMVFTEIDKELSEENDVS